MVGKSNPPPPSYQPQSHPDQQPQQSYFDSPGGQPPPDNQSPQGSINRPGGQPPPDTQSPQGSVNRPGGQPPPDAQSQGNINGPGGQPPPDAQLPQGNAGQYAPQGVPNPPQGNAGQYAPQGMPNPPQGYQFYPQQQPVQTHAMLVPVQQPNVLTPQVMMMNGQCSVGQHAYRFHYGPCGIIASVILFPIGLVFLLIDRERRCVRCGVSG